MNSGRSARRAVGGQLKQLREARGWSQSDLARLSGLDQGIIARLEAGGSEGEASAVERLAGALGVPVGILLSVAVPKTTLPSKVPAARRRRT